MTEQDRKTELDEKLETTSKRDADKARSQRDKARKEEDAKKTGLPHCSLCHKPIEKGQQYTVSKITGDHRHEGGCPKGTKADEESATRRIVRGADEYVEYEGSDDPEKIKGIGTRSIYGEPEVHTA